MGHIGHKITLGLLPGVQLAGHLVQGLGQVFYFIRPFQADHFHFTAGQPVRGDGHTLQRIGDPIGHCQRQEKGNHQGGRPRNQDRRDDFVAHQGDQRQPGERDGGHDKVAVAIVGRRINPAQAAAISQDGRAGAVFGGRSLGDIDAGNRALAALTAVGDYHTVQVDNQHAQTCRLAFPLQDGLQAVWVIVQHLVDPWKGIFPGKLQARHDRGVDGRVAQQGNHQGHGHHAQHHHDQQRIT